MTSRGSLRASPGPTPRMPPHPSSSSSGTPSTSTSTPTGCPRRGRRSWASLRRTRRTSRGKVVGRGVHPVAGHPDELVDRAGVLERGDGVLPPGGVAEDRHVGDLRSRRDRTCRLVKEYEPREEPLGHGRHVLGVDGRQRQGDRGGVAQVAGGDAGRAAHLVEGEGLARPEPDHQQLAGADRVSGGQAQHLAVVGLEAHRAEQRLEPASVGLGHVLRPGAGDQGTLAGARHPDHDEVRAGLGGTALAQRVRRHEGSP